MLLYNSHIDENFKRSKKSADSFFGCWILFPEYNNNRIYFLINESILLRFILLKIPYFLEI